MSIGDVRSTGQSVPSRVGLLRYSIVRLDYLSADERCSQKAMVPILFSRNPRRNNNSTEVKNAFTLESRGYVRCDIDPEAELIVRELVLV